MEGKNIVIVGMGTAAIGAYTAIQQTNPKSKIALIEKRHYESYSPCAMPFAFEGKLPFQNILHDFPRKSKYTKTYLETEAKKIDTEKKEITIKDYENEKVLKYDSLIISTGTKAIVPKIENVEKFLGAYAKTVTTLEDVSNLYSAINLLSNKITGNEVTIIGAGAIGLEFAVAMKNKELEIILAEAMPQIFPNALDKDMADITQKYLEEKGIKIITDAKVEKINGAEKIESVKIQDEEYKSSFVVLACGTIPNLSFVQNSGIKYNKKGIITNNRMRTNVKDVYAIGDCIETYNTITKKRCNSATAIPAMVQGRIAGINTAGGKAVYKGTLNTFISVLEDYAIGATGLTVEQAKKENYDVISQKINGLTKPEWYPGNEQIIVKIVADKKGKLLGGQAFGEKHAVKNRIDIISAYLTRKSKIKEIIQGEITYCPDVTDIPDPLTTAISFISRKTRD